MSKAAIDRKLEEKLMALQANGRKYIEIQQVLTWMRKLA